jgi:hypothetical protein
MYNARIMTAKVTTMREKPDEFIVERVEESGDQL